MSTPTNLTPERFIEEIKKWGATSDALIRVRMMQKGDFVYCRLILPNNGETLQTKISIKGFREFDWMNLSVISVPAVWEDETELIKNLSQKLEESKNASNQNLTPNRYQNIQY